MRSRVSCVVASAIVASAASLANAQIVYDMVSNNGFFTPFNSGNAATVKYGDSGWLGGPGSPPVQLTNLTLRLATFDAAAGGLTDLRITINDGDPSGLVFGSGAALHTVIVPNVVLPATLPGDATYFDLSIPLPAVATTGGFNNVGFSVECLNFSFGGNFGFQCTSSIGAAVGFYTNNASYWDGSSWSLFAFGANPTTGIAQFASTFEVPAPGAASLLAIAGLGAIRRRR